MHTMILSFVRCRCPPLEKWLGKMLVRTILHASLLGVAACWVVPGSPFADVRRRHRALPRTAAPVACAPFRSDAEFDYFRRSKELTIELTKPLGAVLEALPDGGVQIIDIVEGGSASETGLLKKRDKLTDISGADVAAATFDEVSPPRPPPLPPPPPSPRLRPRPNLHPPWCSEVPVPPLHPPTSQPADRRPPPCPPGDGSPHGCGRRGYSRHLADDDRQG